MYYFTPLPTLPYINDFHAHTQGLGDIFYFEKDPKDSTRISIYTSIDSTDYYVQPTPDGKNPSSWPVPQARKTIQFVFPA